MNSPAPQSPLASADQSLIAEVRALRDRVQVQYGLVELLLERFRSNNREHLEAVEIIDPLPVHPLRVDNESDEVGSGSAGGDPEAERSIENAHLVPSGAAWWPMPEKAIQPLLPNPGWEFHGTGSSVSVIGFSLSAMNSEEIEKAVELVRSARRQKSAFIPIFLTDYPDLSIFRRHGLVAEYSPEPAIDAERSGRRPSDRQRLIERKWNISRVFEFEHVMREAALEGGFLLDGGPRLEFRPTAASQSPTEKPVVRNRGAKKPQPKKGRAPRKAAD